MLIVPLPGIVAAQAMPAGGEPEFSPADIAGLLCWYDGGLSDATLVDSKYSQWNDLSGNDSHATQGTADRRPPAGRTINGIDALEFINADNTKISSNTTTGNAGTIFGVISFDVISEAWWYWGSGAQSSPGDAGVVGAMLSSARWRQFASDGTSSRIGDASATGQTAIDTTYIVEQIWDGSTLELHVNGGLQIDNNTGMAGIGDVGGRSMWLGVTNNATSLGFSGLMGAFLMYNSLLSSGDRTSVREYLASRFGVTL